MIFVFICLASFITIQAHVGGSKCCLKVTGSCRSACEQLYLDTIADLETKQQRLLDVHNFCSPYLEPFWRCMNDTEKGEDRKSWRTCCNIGATERCRRACRSASTTIELPHHCRHSDELALFSCVQKLQEGEECCGLARNPECHNLCRKWIQSPSHVLRSDLANTCAHPVINCINNISKPAHLSSPHKYIQCCDKAADPKCREVCKRTLRTRTSKIEIAEVLREAGCPLNLENDKVSQCFLHSDQDINPRNHEKPPKMDLDAAKLHCCSKAGSDQCKRLCHRTFTNQPNQSLEGFDKECLTPAEDNLSQCIDEVEEPCEVGCEGLSYCSTFNNRPKELFRGCDINADNAARDEVITWLQKGSITLPNMRNIYIKNISECTPVTWQTIACTLHIKPCQRKTQVTRICKEDCFKVLTVCLDWSRMGNSVSAAEVCSELTPSDPTSPCISLDPFLSPSTDGYTEALTKPCLPDPCAASELCYVARNCDPNDMQCRPYKCKPGCKLGELSPLMVPCGSYARIPTSVGKNQKGCHKICECTPAGTMARCQSVFCVTQDFCRIGEEKIGHGSSFYKDCNLCSCYAGEITCSKRQCEVSSPGVTDVSHSTLPCNCLPLYSPVCGWNGVTYASSCLAICLGLTDGDYWPGSCSDINPCYENPCAENEICVTKRRVCLPSIKKKCPQYLCVKIPCNNHIKDVVCSTSGEERPNPCTLLANEKLELAYFGECLTECSNEGDVCGVDGNTYPSECHANARYIVVDYPGSCITIGLISAEPNTRCSKTVQCAELIEDGCLGITPPGACCPICTGAIKVLFSQKQIDRTVNTMNDELMETFTVESILKALVRQVQVAECTLRGHLTVESDLLVMVTTVKKNPSAIQLQACILEAEKLAVLIQRSSPRIVSELSLSFLTAATIIHQPVTSASVSSLVVPTVFSLTSISLLLILIYISNANVR